ncbi:DNA/RNA non-specific endonuclease [Enterococcus sp. AZ103]|uniref:DNA/RNA non-specific endonuclease n=1 Tax=Enterococcus sp. AZ103 TaxID=2774628 RepID=UPI003F240443
MVKKKRPTVVSGIIILLAIAYGVYSQSNPENQTISTEPSISSTMPSVTIDHLSEIPDYNGEKVITLNQNNSNFNETDLSLANGSWTIFSDLDDLNRVGPANGMLSQELMPTEERESLNVKPTGWHQKFYDDQPLYNRCHLVAFQLSGENNNWKNLMTGTARFNHPGMTKYEEEVGDYIRETKHHVRYRVSPYFKDDELVARGVQMEAQSIEDSNVSYNVFIYNVQDGVTIDYTTGYSKAS